MPNVPENLEHRNAPSHRSRRRAGFLLVCRGKEQRVAFVARLPAAFIKVALLEEIGFSFEIPQELRHSGLRSAFIRPARLARKDQTGCGGKGRFQKAAAVPLNGTQFGCVSGIVIDHRKPLECRGTDAPSNMQWQTTAAAKAKDRTERYCR